MSKTLAIVGMHRSATSLTAHWLHESGLFLGDKLAPADSSNLKGHFEDREILQFHRRILQENGWADHLVRGEKPIITTDQHAEQARAIIQQRMSYENWGWKEPRATLFLDFWREMLPDLKFLALYRHHAQVVDSLLRREKGNQQRKYRFRGTWRAFVKHTTLSAGASLEFSALNFSRVNLYAQVWKRYNQDLMAFIQKYPNDVLLLHIDTLIAHHPLVLQTLNEQWGFTLHTFDIRHIYEEQHLQRNPHRTIRLIDKVFGLGCESVYRRLQELEAGSLQRIGAARAYA